MDNGIEEQFRVVLLEKGGICMIACGTHEPPYFTDKNSDFASVINSFKVQCKNILTCFLEVIIINSEVFT